MIRRQSHLGLIGAKGHLDSPLSVVSPSVMEPNGEEATGPMEPDKLSCYLLHIFFLWTFSLW